jgi:hypothetical protein
LKTMILYDWYVSHEHVKMNNRCGRHQHHKRKRLQELLLEYNLHIDMELFTVHWTHTISLHPATTTNQTLYPSPLSCPVHANPSKPRQQIICHIFSSFAVLLAQKLGIDFSGRGFRGDESR